MSVLNSHPTILLLGAIALSGSAAAVEPAALAAPHYEVTLTLHKGGREIGRFASDVESGETLGFALQPKGADPVNRAVSTNTADGQMPELGFSARVMVEPISGQIMAHCHLAYAVLDNVKTEIVQNVPTVNRHVTSQAMNFEHVFQHSGDSYDGQVPGQPGTTFAIRVTEK